MEDIEGVKRISPEEFLELMRGGSEQQASDQGEENGSDGD